MENNFGLNDDQNTKKNYTNECTWMHNRIFDFNKFMFDFPQECVKFGGKCEIV